MSLKQRWTISLQNRDNRSLSKNPTWQSRGKIALMKQRKKEIHLVGGKYITTWKNKKKQLVMRCKSGQGGSQTTLVQNYIKSTYPVFWLEMEFDWAVPGGHLHLHHKQLMLEVIQMCQIQPLCQVTTGSRMLQHKAQSSIRIKHESQRATLVLEQTSFLTLLNPSGWDGYSGNAHEMRINTRLLSLLHNTT